MSQDDIDEQTARKYATGSPKQWFGTISQASENNPTVDSEFINTFGADIVLTRVEQGSFSIAFVGLQPFADGKCIARPGIRPYAVSQAAAACFVPVNSHPQEIFITATDIPGIGAGGGDLGGQPTPTDGWQMDLEVLVYD